MKSVACLLCVGALALAGCNTASPPPADPADPAVPIVPVSANQPPISVSDPGSRVVATIAGEPITLGDLMTPLIKAHGLTTLLQLVELDLARKQIAEQGMTVTPADIAHEREITLGHLFQQTDDKIQADIEEAQRAHNDKLAKDLQDELKDQHLVLISQFLDNQHIAESEFDTAVEINACLRKIAGPVVDKALTNDVVYRAFGEQYGEQVRVRYIQVSKMEQIAKIRAQLKAGVDFGDLAFQMSENAASRELRGELPPFSAKDSNYPQSFRDAAFALKNPGDISDVVEYKDALYLIKLEGWVAPVAVKFEDVKDSLRATLAENLTQQAIKSLHEWLGQKAMKEMKITDPIMKQQFQDRQDEQGAQIRDQKRIKEEMELEHHKLWDRIDAATQAATAPAATQP